MEELAVGKAADELMQEGCGRAVGVHAGPGDECGYGTHEDNLCWTLQAAQFGQQGTRKQEREQCVPIDVSQQVFSWNLVDPGMSDC